MNGFDKMVLTDVFRHAQKMSNDSSQTVAIREAAKKLVGTMLKEAGDLSQSTFPEEQDTPPPKATLLNFPQNSS